MKKKKQLEGFNLAFLDIMSCGLGAIILVFMLIKHHTSIAAAPDSLLQSEIQALKTEKNELEELLRTLSSNADTKAQSNQTLAGKVKKMNQLLTHQNLSIAQAETALKQLREDIKKIKVSDSKDLIEIKNEDEENYLLGLKVKGEKIIILLDASASMTGEKIIDVIKIKNSSLHEKRNAKKWLRAKKTAKWLLSRLPQNSEIIVIAFNDSLHYLGGNNWRAANSQTDMQSITADLEQLTPEGATNLQKGLIDVKRLQPTNLYLITDSLPTVGESNYKSLNPFADCNSLSGNANTISGTCRTKLFRQTILETALVNVTVDVVLLPIEGDPDALNNYWGWASTTGGLVISPAANWP